MIYIKGFVPNKSVTIRADGILDQQSIPILKKVCQNHLNTGIKVLLNLDGLTHIAREGRDFLQTVKDQVIVESSPQFLQMQDDD